MMYEEIYSYFISVMEQGIFDAILSSPLVIVN